MKLLHFAGVVLMGLAAVVAGVPFNEKGLPATNKLGAESVHHRAVGHTPHVLDACSFVNPSRP